MARTHIPPTQAAGRLHASLLPIEEHRALEELRSEAAHCRACPLWKHATQTVFGEGRPSARVMLVGEQPGDKEDLAGHPFVGPAGQLLDRALGDAGLQREAIYVTNAVKHFKWEVRDTPRGKRRMHKTPGQLEIDACHQWLERELAAVEPDLVVALGATAARALLHRITPVKANRGRLMPFAVSARAAAHESTLNTCQMLITTHPSALLRMPGELRAAAYERFVRDLTLARPFVRLRPRSGR